MATMASTPGQKLQKTLARSLRNCVMEGIAPFLAQIQALGHGAPHHGQTTGS